MPNKSTLCRVRANLIRRRINAVVIKYAAWANNNMIIIMVIIVIIVVKYLKTPTQRERHRDQSRQRFVVVNAKPANSRARVDSRRRLVN